MSIVTAKAAVGIRVVDVEAVTDPIADVAVRIARYLTYALFVVVPLAYSPPTYDLFDLPKVIALRILTAAALLSLAVAALAQRRFVLRRTAIDLPCLLYLAALTLATALSINPLLSLNGEFLRYDGLYTTLSYAAAAFLVIQVLGRERVQRPLAVLVLTAGVAALEGIAERLGHGLLPGAYYFGARPSSFAGNPDFFGTYLVLAAPIALGLLLAARHGRARLGWAAAFVLLTIALLVTETRGAWLGFLASMPVFLLAARLVAKRWIWLLAAFGLILLGIVGVSSVAQQLPAIQPRGQMTAAVDPDAAAAPTGQGINIVDRVTSVANLSGGTVGVRLMIWQSALKLISERPLLGYGPNTLQGLLSKYLPPEYARTEGKDRDPDRAHNNYLQLAATSGLAGLSAYLVVLLAFAIAMLRWLRRTSNHVPHILGTAILAAWFGYIVQDFFLFGVIDTSSQWWLLMGLGIALTVDGARARYLVLKLDWPLLARAALLTLAGAVVFLIVLGSVRMWQADLTFMTGRQLFHSVDIRAGTPPGLAEYRQATEMAPDEWYYLEIYGVALATVGDALPAGSERTEYLDLAIRTMNKAISLQPQYHALYVRRGAIFEMYGEDHRIDALRDYQRAVSLYPYSYWGNKQLAMAARHFEAADVAIGAARAYLALEPDDRIGRVNLAVDYIVAKRFAEAKAVLDDLLALDPNDVDAHITLGLGYERQGQKEQALAEYRLAVAVDPHNERANAAIARIEGTEVPSGPLPAGHP